MTSLWRRPWDWFLTLVPNDEQMEAAESEKREKALTDFLNRQETARAQRQQLRELDGHSGHSGRHGA